MRYFQPIIEEAIKREGAPKPRPKERPEPYNHTVIGIAEFLIFIGSLYILWTIVDWLAFPPETRALTIVAVGVIYAVIFIPASKIRSNNLIELLNLITIPLGAATLLIIVLSIFNGDFGDLGGAVPVINNVIEEVTTALQMK